MSNQPIHKTSNVLASLAVFVIVVGGMEIAAPLLLALFIAIWTASPYAWLQNKEKGVSRPLALLGGLLDWLNQGASASPTARWPSVNFV